MSARYEGVRVYADCPRCEGSGVRFPVRVDLPAMGVVRCCEPCDGSGRVSVPASEWAEALATVEGVGVKTLSRVGYEWRVGSWSAAFETRTAVVLPASASTREDGQR